MRLAEWIRHDLDEVTAILAQMDEDTADALVAAILSAPRVFVVGLRRTGCSCICLPYG